MTQYRKKPVTIEAMQFKGLPSFGPNNKKGEWGEDFAYLELFDAWLFKNQGDRKCRYRGNSIIIPTLEGEMIASPGDWLIRGVQGEIYPCKPDIFEQTYEVVE